MHSTSPQSTADSGVGTRLHDVPANKTYYMVSIDVDISEILRTLSAYPIEIALRPIAYVARLSQWGELRLDVAIGRSCYSQDVWLEYLKK